MDSIPLFSQLQTQQNAAFGIPAMFTFDDRSLRAVSVNAAFQGTTLPDMLSYLDDGGRMHPRDVAKTIKRVYPDFATGDAAGDRQDDPYDDWGAERASREKGMLQVQDAIRKTETPSQEMLRYLNLTPESYQAYREQLLRK